MKSKKTNNDDESSNNNILYIIAALVLMFFNIDISKLQGTPSEIHYSIIIISIIIVASAWAYYFRDLRKWFLEIKSILWYLLAVIVSSLPIIGIISFLFSAFIVYYDFEGEELIQEKCLITNVSGGKHRNLYYDFRGKSFQTKNFYYQNYKNCGYDKNECYIMVTFKKKPFGMLLELNIEKWYNE